MYLRRTLGAKRDPVTRWNLPDRIFFACGARHVPADAVLVGYGGPGMTVLRFEPAPGFTGNLIVAAAKN